MDRQQLLRQLTAHRPIDNHEAGFLKRTQQFVASTPHCFERSYLNGHVTGSAWIVSPDRTHAILLHHQKLDRWFQPGGHADGEPDILKVAMTEAQEETGLSANQLTIISHRIFDIDVHRIPARPGEPTYHPGLISKWRFSTRLIRRRIACVSCAPLIVRACVTSPGDAAP